MWLVCALNPYNINRHSFAFSFDEISAKEKASQKENAVFRGLCPIPRKFFEKNLTKNFPAELMRTLCAETYFSCHPERSEAESNFFVLDPKRHCVPFAPHFVRSSTALRMTRTKKRRAKQGGIYEQLAHNVRTNRKNNVGEDIILPLCFNTNQPQINIPPYNGGYFSFGHSPNITGCAQVRFRLACQPRNCYLLPINGSRGSNIANWSLS